MNGEGHPVNSSLLALLRGQQLEDAQRIRLHLARCGKCQKAYADLSDSSSKLDVLQQMSLYQRYPEISPALILRQAQQNALKQSLWSELARRAVNRPRPKRGALRLVSLPAAFAMLLLFMTVIVLAYTLAHYVPSPRPLSRDGLTFNTATSTSALVIHTQTPRPTQNPTLTATVSPSPTGTPDTDSHKPSIANCSTDANYLVICGTNFKPGDKVSLIEEVSWNDISSIQITVRVNAKGQFKVTQPIYLCKQVPSAITAKDSSSKPAVYSNTLTGITVPGCWSRKPPRGVPGTWTSTTGS